MLFGKTRVISVCLVFSTPPNVLELTQRTPRRIDDYVTCTTVDELKYPVRMNITKQKSCFEDTVGHNATFIFLPGFYSRWRSCPRKEKETAKITRTEAKRAQRKIDGTSTMRVLIAGLYRAPGDPHRSPAVYATKKTKTLAKCRSPLRQRLRTIVCRYVSVCACP